MSSATQQVFLVLPSKGKICFTRLSSLMLSRREPHHVVKLTSLIRLIHHRQKAG